MKLLLINLRVTLYRLGHFCHTVLFYYPMFLWIDLKLASQYLWKSPYKLTEEYGETPLKTLDKIATEFRILSHNRVMELGCGTGRTCFFLRKFIGCTVIGVDTSAALIKKARRVNADVIFREEDMIKTKLDADILYFYGTSFSDEFIKKMAARMTQKVITVSFPLSDYDKRYSVEKVIEGSFPWGKTEIYFNVLTRPIVESPATAPPIPNKIILV